MDELRKALQAVSDAQIKALKEQTEKLPPHKFSEKFEANMAEIISGKPMSRLKRVRINKGLTQDQLSKLSCVNLRTLQDYEQKSKDINGARAITLWKLAKVLGCQIEDILEI